MANEKEDKKEKKKKGGCISGCFVGILAIVLIITLLISFIFAIFEAIIGIIKDVILGIIDGVLEFLANPIEWVMTQVYNLKNFFSERLNQGFDPQQYIESQPRQLVEISQDEFIKMKDSLDSSRISRDVLGLDDLMLKKMLLTWHTGNYSHNADIIIEITKDEYESGETDPFEKKQGCDIFQISVKWTEEASNALHNFFDGTETKLKNQDKQDKYYLCATGVLTFVNEAGNELQYFNKDILETMYINEFQVNRYGSSDEYAADVWKYLSTSAYTDGDQNKGIGMQMYSYEEINEQLIEQLFDDRDEQWYNFTDYKPINKRIVDDEYIITSKEWADECKYDGLVMALDIFDWDVGVVDINKKTYDIQHIDYSTIVSNYSTPVELMVNLLNISSSKEFVNAFIDKVINQTEIKLKIYNTRSSYGENKVEITHEKTTVDAMVDVTARVKGIRYENEKGETVNEELDVPVDVTPYTGKFLWIDKLELNFKDMDNLPKVNGLAFIEVTRRSQEGTKTYSEWTGMANGKFSFNSGGWFDDWGITPTESNTNIAMVTRQTRTLKTINKVDIAVEYAKTWYGTQQNNNYRSVTKKFETKETESATTRVPAKKSTLIWEDEQYTPIMIPKDKDTEYIIRNDENDGIFADKSPEDFFWEAVWSDVHGWYADLDGDDVGYWLAPGGQFADMATVLGDGRWQLSNETELQNIRFVYTIENGWRVWWADANYRAYQMKYEPIEFTDKNHGYSSFLSETGYAVGYLYETVEIQLVKSPGKWVDNTDFFLSLLKNSTGEYDRNAKYDPNGKEIKYKTIYGNEARVGVLLENGGEMLLDLLGRSPNTQGEIYSGMKVALDKYKKEIGGIVSWDSYENPFEDEWKPVEDKAA